MKREKIFPPALEVGEKCRELSFFKSQVIGTKKEFSWQQMTNIKKRCADYKKTYSIEFSITFSRIGEADLWKIKSINSGGQTTITQSIKTQLGTRVKKTKNKINEWSKGVQGNLFDTDPFTMSIKNEETLTMWNH